MSSNSRIETYKEAIAIEQERAALQSRLDQLQARLEQLKGSLISNAGSTPARLAIKSSATAAAPRKPRAGRGELKQQILDALAAAGDAGLGVRELAAALDRKPALLHSWFQFARRSIKAIRKAGRGRYRLVGAAPAAPIAAKAKPAKVAKTGRKTARQQRGSVSIAVQAGLKSAGANGIHVADLAKSLGMSPRNLFVWFSTTGKKFKAIKKVSPGHYRLKS